MTLVSLAGTAVAVGARRGVPSGSSARTAAAAPAAGETGVVVLRPQDTFLNLNAVNYSGDPRLSTYTWPDFQAANAILMTFDFSPLPAGAIIQQATLSLSLVESDGAADGYAVSAHKLIDVPPVIAAATGYTADGVTAWTANACCASGVPLAHANISAAYDAQTIDTTPGAKTWTLTAMAQEWLADPAHNFGVLLDSDVSKPKDRYRYFASMESADPAARPFLRVTYTAPDTTAPVVGIATPANGSTTSGPVTIDVTATDNVGVASVQILLDGAPLGAERTTAPYGLTWDSATVSDGAHVISAIGRDASGNSAVAAGVTVTLRNGVVILRPEDTYLNLDAVNYSTAPTLGTYTWPDQQPANAIAMTFDLSAVPAGALVQQATLHLALVESDGAADTYAVAVRKIVGPHAVIARATGFSADGVTNWTANVCCANGVPLAQVDLSSPYDTQALTAVPGLRQWTVTNLIQEWLAAPATNGGLVLNADITKPKDRFRYFASMESPDASLRPYVRVTYVLTDLTPPVVAVVSPVPGAKLSSTVAVAAVASDPSGIVGVLFTVDGAPIGPEITAEPFVTTWRTTAVANGTHTLAAVARDAAGNVQAAAVVAVVANDTTPPAVSVSASSVRSASGAITLRATASDNVGVTGVQFRIDGAAVGAEDTTSPYAISWNSASVANGSHTLTAIARDAAGNTRTSAGLAITTANDKTAPTVSLTAPAAGASVTGTITVRAGASDNAGVAGVQFTLDGAVLGAEDRTSPYAITWNTTTATSGSHVLTAVARDAAGNVATSAGRTVIVANGPVAPVITLVAATAPTTSSAIVTWTTNVTSDSQVDYGPTTTYGSSTALAPALVTTHAVSLTGLAGGATYHFRVRSKTAAGAVATSGDASFATPVPPPPPPPAPAIATQFPGDVNIESHPDVVFVERFDEPTLAQLFGRWSDVLNGPAMSFSTDAPAGSPGARSLTIPWQGGGVNNGGHLYKQLTPGVDDTLYVRYYIKYPTSGTYQHSGVWTGGANPALGWPNPQAGVKPTGSDRFSAAAEQDPLSSRFDHYDYWMNMRAAVDGNFWGNRLLNAPAVTAPTGQWACVEQMVKLNNPVSASNGEHAIWLDGVKVSHLGPGFPKGVWSGGNFTQDPAGTPFEGFQWRTDANLNLNWIWLQTYASTDPPGFQADMKFANVVVAKKPIGCMTPLAPAPGAVLFDSAWDTSAGTSTAAVTDGGRWSNYWEFNGGSSVQLLSVVPGGPNGHNALRVQQRGSSFAANVQVDNVVPVSTDYYLRFYMRNDDTSVSGDHIVTVDTWQYANLTFMRKTSTAGGWTFKASLYGCGYTYPIGHWGPAAELARGQWYRFEYFVHFVDATHIQLHPRVYDANGTLLYSDAEFVQSDYMSGGSWNGREDWTLASYYAGGNSFCVDPAFVNDIGLGNNGQFGATDTGQYWYFGGVQIRTDTWPGPIATAGGAPAGASSDEPSLAWMPLGVRTGRRRRVVP